MPDRPLATLDATQAVEPPDGAVRQNEWAGRLLKAEAENHCGDAACQTRRTAAAVAVLTGWKEHQDLCWAVEVFQVEIGTRDPELVGPEPYHRAARSSSAPAELPTCSETYYPTTSGAASVACKNKAKWTLYDSVRAIHRPVCGVHIRTYSDDAYFHVEALQ